MAFLLPAVEVISASLPELYVVKVLEFLAASFEESRHLEFYLIWTQKLLMSHGQRLKSRYKMASPLLLTCGQVTQAFGPGHREDSPPCAYIDGVSFPGRDSCCLWSSSFRRASSGI